MEAKLLLSLPEGFEVTSIEGTDGILTIGAVSTQKSACCPLCSSLATRVHSFYTRTLADLPCAGQQVRLLLQVHYSCTCLERACPKGLSEKNCSVYEREGT